MIRKDLDYLVIAALLFSILYVTLTGLLMDLFGAPQFIWHSYAGYAATILAGLHLALNWGRVTAYLGHRLRRPKARVGLARSDRATWPARRTFLAAGLAATGGFALGRLTVSRSPRLPNDLNDLGALYHRWSSPGYNLSLSSILNWGSQPARYKSYPQAESIALPAPGENRNLEKPLGEAIEERRSRREYAAMPISLAQLGALLFTAGGITDPNWGYRAAPSAGALYPIEIYPVVHRVQGLEGGLYHYAVADHRLERLQTGDLRTELVAAGIGQELLGQAAVCFVLTAIFQRTRWKYRERAYRYILLEAGHIGQNLYLAATAMGLGACAVGAFLDESLNELLGIDSEEEAAIYLISVGPLS